MAPPLIIALGIVLAASPAFGQRMASENAVSVRGVVQMFIDMDELTPEQKRLVGLIDLREESDKHPGGSFKLDDVHLNGAGHGMYGEVIAAYLSEKYSP